MKKTIASATFLLLGVGAAAVGANIRGSDTMEDVVKFMLNNGFCPGTTGLTYEGGGSTDGEQAMTGTGAAPLNVASQSAAPMSRALSAANVCTTTQGSPTTSAGIFTCLDGLAIVASANGAPSCDLKYTPGNATDWKDVLRLVYAGAKPGTDNTGMDCNSATRRALVNNWGSLFNSGCTSTGGVSCTQLQHAWRRSDMSGTTDTFLSLVSLPARTANPFCNGVGITGTITVANTTDFADNDPVRRTCLGTTGTTSAGEQVCNYPLPDAAGIPTELKKQGTLGLVQVVFTPESSATLTQAQIYPTAICDNLFDWVSQPPGILCPYGKASTLGACLLPYQNVGGTKNFACINSRLQRGFFLSNTVPAGDGRVFNLITRQTSGAILRDNSNRRLLGSYYRIHTTRPAPTGAGTGCQHPTSTGQIGCLAAASPCSIGFAGREAAGQPGATALRIRGLAPTPPNIQALITNPSAAYPISRKLYYNSVVNPDILASSVGTVDFRQAQKNLKTCFANANLARTACEAYGFVEAPAGPVCEDFNEQTGCPAGGFASNTNACP